MVDIKKAIAGSYKPQYRFSNFSTILTKVKISGFRGVNDLELTFDSPITALSGSNGSGKSTIAQLIACGYKKIATVPDTRRYYVKDFFKVTQLDQNSIDLANGFVEYHYATNVPDRGQTVTVKRAQSEWSGYKRQPERTVWYVGFTLYIPKVERKDFSVHQAQNLVLGNFRVPSEDALRWTSKILGNTYDEVGFTSVSHINKQTEIGRLTRFGSQYSESNMGFGEGRVLYLVDLLENSPSNSLIILEEPETSLHPVAQYNLSQYLLDVTFRKKHQIIITTHSENLLSGLPLESRKFLLRQENTIEVIDGISNTHASSFLTGNFSPALTICVEDTFAKEVLTEIIRRDSAEILDLINIQPIGDARAVMQAVEILNANRKNSIGIRDADKGEDRTRKMYKLPGSLPPEKEVINCEVVKSNMENFYRIDVDTFLTANPELDHHEYYKVLAKKAHVRTETLETECIRKYVESLTEEEIERIIQHIRTSL